MIKRNSKGQFIKGYTSHRKGKEIRLKRICLRCGKEFEIQPCREKTAKYCSRGCIHRNQRSGHWKNGRRKDIQSGYISIYSPNHPLCDKMKYVYEHRLIAEKCLNRLLTPIERIHHIGTKYPLDDIRNKSDNRPQNLYLFSNIGEHFRFHRLKNKPNLISNLI